MRYLIPLLLLFPTLLFAASVTITADRPTAREDGSALEANDISGYVLDHNGALITTTGADLNHTVEDLPNGSSHTFRAATVDTDGIQGEFTEAVSVNIPNAPPNAPSNLTVTINVTISTGE